MNGPRILLADDHELVLERVTTLLQSAFEVVGATRDGREMVHRGYAPEARHLVFHDRPQLQDKSQ